MAFLETLLIKTAPVRLFISDHQAAFEIGGGIACFAVSVAAGVKAGIKVQAEISEYNKLASECEVHKAEGMITLYNDNQQEIVPFTENDYTRAKRKLKIRTTGKIAKAVAPSVLTFAGGTFLVLHAHHIMVKTNIALAAALQTANDRLEKYRAKNAEVIGEEKEQMLYDGQTVEKQGKKTYIVQGTPLSKYARLMSRDTLGRDADWCNSSNDYNMARVKRIEEWANRKLKVDGKITRKEVYDGLGFDVSNEDPDCEVDGWRLVKYGGKTEEGGIVIKIIDHIGGGPKNGAYVKDPFDGRYVRSADAFWIDLNCEGCILANSTLRKLGGIQE